MAPVYLKPLATNHVAERIQSHVSSFPLPIAFAPSKRASGKHKATNFWEFKMRFDPSDEKSQKTKKSVLTFEDGDAEMWCKWREQLDELYWIVPLTTAKKRRRQLCHCYVAKLYLALYTTHRSRIEHEQSDRKAKSDSLIGILSAHKVIP
jgi:hypothetical protein